MTVLSCTFLVTFIKALLVSFGGVTFTWIFMILGSLRWCLHMWVNALLFQTLNVCSDRDSAPPVSSVWVSGFHSSYRGTFIFQWMLNFCCWWAGRIKMKVISCWHDADVTLLSFFFERSISLDLCDFTHGFVAEWQTDSRDYLNATITSVFCYWF